MAKKFRDISNYTSPQDALELFRNSMTEGLVYDAYGVQTKFRAIVLSRPVPISMLKDKITSFFQPPGKLTGASKAQGKDGSIARFVFKARILGTPSPHDFLPNPCNSTYAIDGANALDIIGMHTKFVSPTDYRGSPPKIGDIVNVKLKANVFSYNLQEGEFTSLAARGDGLASAGANLAECSISLNSLFKDKFELGDPTLAMGGPIGYPVGDFTVSGTYEEKLAAVLGSYEGLRLTAYPDPDPAKGWSVPTIGIGATFYPPGFRLSGKVKKGDTITEAEAIFIKKQHIISHRARLLKAITREEYSKLPDGVKAALESKVFNYGSLHKELARLVKEAVKSADYSKVSAYFRTTLAAHNKGLNAWRRRDEADMIDFGKSPRAKIDFGTGATAATELSK
jgi:GH24 family phage-related lysozyme (muramidase)